PHGGEEAEHDPDGGAEHEPDDRPFDRHVGVEMREDHDQVAEREPRQDADHAANVAQHHGLEQELHQDAPPPRPERLADADLARSLGHRDQHDVHDADARHDQRDDADDER